MPEPVVSTEPAPAAAAPAAPAAQGTPSPAPAPVAQGGGSLLTGLTPEAAPASPGGQPSAAPAAAAPAATLPAWTKQLPKDLQSEARFTRFSTIGELGKAFLELEGKAGSMVKVPGPDASEEEKAAYWKSQGVPDAPDHYDLQTDVKLPEGLNYDEATASAFKAFCHENHVPQDTAKAMYAWANQRTIDAIATAKADQAAALKTTVASLRKDWGSGYERTLAGVQRYVGTLAKSDPQLKADLDRTGFGNSLSGLRFFATLAKQVNPHDFVEGAPVEGTAKEPAQILFGGSMKG